MDEVEVQEGCEPVSSVSGSGQISWIVSRENCKAHSHMRLGEVHLPISVS